MSKYDNKKKAVALKYQEDTDVAPVVIASGYGTVAEKIVEIAEQKGIPVFRDDSAASLMCMLEVGRSIPPELYECVAAVYLNIMQISSGIKHYQSEAGTQTPNKKRIDNLREKVAGGAEQTQQKSNNENI